MRILIADDDEDVRTILRVIFEKQGHDVVEADDGEGAIILAMAEEPDVVVLDIMLPALDGFSALRELRRLSQTQDLAVFVLSARAIEEDIRRGLELGADDYITKPFIPDNLVALVDRVGKMAPPDRMIRRQAQLALL